MSEEKNYKGSSEYPGDQNKGENIITFTIQGHNSHEHKQLG